MLKLINKKFLVQKYLLEFWNGYRLETFWNAESKSSKFWIRNAANNKRGRGKKGDKKAEEKSAKEKPGYLKILNIDSLK
jgi:hypothetical protein